MAGPRPRPGIIEIEAYVGGKAEVGGRRAIKLSANESAIGPSPRAIDAYRSVAMELHRYPDGGATELRSALGRAHNLDAGRIVCGAGSDELISLLTRAYAGPGDEVLYSAHGFLMYKLAALAAGAHPVAAAEIDLCASVDNVLALVGSRTRIVFIANPNNPTGSYLPASELARLHAGLPDDVLLVIDAAYAEFVSRDDYSSGMELAERADNVVMTRTFSKLFGLASLRLGWLYAAPAVADIINRTRGPFNVGQSAQAAGIAALEDVEHQAAARAHNDRWLPWLAGRIEKLGLEVLPSVGNFFLIRFSDEPGRSVADANAFLEARGIIPRMVAAYGLPDCLRVSVGLEDENRALVAAIGDFISTSRVR